MNTANDIYGLSIEDLHVSKRLLKFLVFHYVDFTKETYCDYWQVKRYLEIIYTVDNWNHNNALN